MIETVVPYIASYAEGIIEFLWLPLFIWTVLAVTGWAVLRILPNLHPQVQYLGRLAIILALPAGLVALSAMQSFEKIWFTESTETTFKFVTFASPIEISTITVTAEQTQTVLWTEWAYAILLLILTIGIFFFAARFLIQYLKLYRLKNSLPLFTISSLHELDSVNRTMAGAYKRRISMAFINKEIVPVTFGLLSPVILLPVSLKKDGEKLNLAIRHELTHITQNDFLSHCTVIIMQLLFWFHPMIHLLKKELIDYRELRCDSLVLNSEDISPGKYASLLLEFLPIPNINREFSVNMAQESTNIKKRVQMIVQQTSKKPVPKRASLTIFITILISTVLAMACTDMQTQQIFDHEDVNLMTDIDQDGTRGYHQILIFMSDEEQADRHMNALAHLQEAHPGHIMSIEILQGEAAIEQFGERADDGVIQINTNIREESYNRVLSALGFSQFDLSLHDPYENEEIFYVVEQNPELIGGLESIQRQVRYPEAARRAGIEGRVYVQFVVNEEGNAAYPRVTRGIGGGADEEALRVVNNAKFTPAIHQGRPVKVHYTLPVFFRLSVTERDQTIQPYSSVVIENPEVIEREIKVEVQKSGNILSGRVLDSENGNPLAGANIFIPGSNTATVADTNGHFTLKNMADVPAIEISYIGYQRTQVTI